MSQLYFYSSKLDFLSFITILRYVFIWFFLVLSPFDFFFLPFFLKITIWIFEFYHNLRFVLSPKFKFWSLITIWFFFVSSQLQFLSFITIWFFEFNHNLSFWVSSQFEFLSCMTIWVFEFHHNLGFSFSSQFFFVLWKLFFCFVKTVFFFKYLFF